MTTNPRTFLVLAWLAMTTLASPAAARRGLPPSNLEVRDDDRLEARYRTRMEALREELRAALPRLDERRKGVHVAARATEKEAEAMLQSAQQSLRAIETARALVEHAKGKWIGGAEQGIAQAEEKLARATTEVEREAARKELLHWQENRAAGLRALGERQAAYEEAKRGEEDLRRTLRAAEETLERAKAETRRTLDELGVEAFLGRDELDARLAEFVVLLEATPRGLASFAGRGEAERALVDSLLSDHDLMLRMIVADGAKDGGYGRAIEIYDQIQRTREKAQSGSLQRLALAIALEHAVPVKQRNPVAATEAPAIVDPLGRYDHYEQAFLAGELDPCFSDLTVWEYRMVVDGDEPDETLAWGREMLRNYRPDHVYTSDERWRYVGAVRTDIRYGSQDNGYDRDDLQFYQNILMNGGVCGRRAFFGRFLLRAFGVPTTARPQRGHAALVHRTNEGWVICLGAGWGSGWTKTRYGKDQDFLATTQARKHPSDYLQVKRAQWIGDVLGEKRVFGLLAGEPGFWYGISLLHQQAIVEDSKAVALAPVGEELAEANESIVEYRTEAATVTEEDRRIVIDGEGVITIPAVACTRPRKSTSKVLFLPSVLGGKQLHHSRNGQPEDFEYVFEAKAAGPYELTARVVTPSWQQHLSITANAAKEPVDLPLPHTVGLWAMTQPVVVDLVEGRNVLRFRAWSEGHAKGFSIRDFTLSPVKR